MMRSMIDKLARSDEPLGRLAFWKEIKTTNDLYGFHMWGKLIELIYIEKLWYLFQCII